MSRIGRMPVAIPANVEIKIAPDNTVSVKGPNGVLTRTLHKDMILAIDGGAITVS
jgi:large subunit ribosomal protein L6